MNWDRIGGNLMRLKGCIRRRWGLLADDDVRRIEGECEYLLGGLQVQAGIARAQVRRQIRRLERSA